MPSLGATFGRGGATTYVQDLRNADCILIEGSNFAECHPVAFRFVMEAKERGAKIIHVDPRFTRTSAVADLYAPIRSGSDIVFLGAIANWLLTNERYFREYVVAYTNATTIVCEDFKDTEDLDGLFSGLRDETATYDTTTWAFETEEVPRFDGDGTVRVPKRDETLHAPALRAERAAPPLLALHRRAGRGRLRHAARALRGDLRAARRRTAGASGRPRSPTPSAGRSTRSGCSTSAPRRSCRCCSVTWDGRAAAVMALRGHANIQGATDIATLYDLLPGYLPMPSALRDEGTLAAYLKTNTKPTGWWSNVPKYVISLLKAWYGDVATSANDYCFETCRS